MRLEHIADVAFDHIFGRILRRALLAAAIAVFALVAIYHFTVAGTITLEAQYGALYAQLIVAAIFTALAAICYAILWAMGRKAASSVAPALTAPREMQMAMLIEAVMLGYALARKRERAS